MENSIEIFAMRTTLFDLFAVEAMAVMLPQHGSVIDADKLAEDSYRIAEIMAAKALRIRKQECVKAGTQTAK